MNQPAQPIDAGFAAHARIQRADYERLYAQSVAGPEAFWGGVSLSMNRPRPPKPPEKTDTTRTRN